MLLCTLLVGETNQVSTNLQNLENNRFEGALLYGKRLVLITDSERYGGAISTLKSITGGDPIRYERKNRQQQAPCSPGIISKYRLQPLYRHRKLKMYGTYD
jgi:putative DNA primase/helicase